MLPSPAFLFLASKAKDVYYRFGDGNMKLTTGRRDGFFVFQFTTHTRTVTVTVTVTDSSPKSLVSTGAACQNPSAVSESKTGDGLPGASMSNKGGVVAL